jgi:hypothetical protein
MALSKLCFINTGGGADLTTSENVDAIVDELARHRRVVLHFHGGLVSKQAGLEGAERLKGACYDLVPAHPVFFIWESGLLEVISHNLGEIAGEDIFKTLLKWLLKFTVGKLEQTPGEKGIEFRTPTDMEFYEELSLREPFEDVKAPEGLSEITPAQQASFARQLASDSEFQRSASSAVSTLLPTAVATGEKGAVTLVRKSARTLMSPDVIESLTEGIEREGEKGFIATAKLAQSAATVLVRVIKRFRGGHDHGVYPTVVEEILREFYLANVGQALWTAMKKQTLDAFSPSQNGTLPGGTYFVRKLAHALDGGARPEISLVGHSAGSVFINNLLNHVGSLKNDTQRPLPSDFAFKDVIFLAPACTFESFLPSITMHRPIYRNFRMFTMSDAAERQDVLVPSVYTRSLLYLIAGILESAVDMPIVGMERYYVDQPLYSAPEIIAARTFLKTISNGTVWSPYYTTSGVGLCSKALSHGAFGEDPDTLASVRTMLAS